MKYLLIILNILITLFALSAVMVSLLFAISGDDVAKTQKKFITQATDDLKTVWIFGGFNLQQSLLTNSKKAPEDIEREFDERIRQARQQSEESKTIKNESNAKLLRKAQSMIFMFFALTMAFIMYGISVEAFTFNSSMVTLIVTILLFLSEYVFFLFVIKPYTHSTTKVLYYKTLTAFLDRNSSYKMAHLHMKENRDTYCNKIKYINYV